MTSADSAPAATDSSGEFFFEDHRIGQTLCSGPVTFDPRSVHAYLEAVGARSDGHEPDGAGANVAGAHVIGACTAWIAESGMARHIVAETSHTWDVAHPVTVGDTVTFELTVTRTAPTRDRSRGLVDRAIEVRAADGTVLQSATSQVLVAARDAEPAAAGEPEFTVPWARTVAAELEGSAEFVACTSTWDGSIALDFGPETVQFRIYRGRVIDVGRRTPAGPTFTLALSPKNWARLLTGPTNDFTERAMRGQTSTSGNAYEYIRHTRTIIAMVDAMRAVAAEENR